MSIFSTTLRVAFSFLACSERVPITLDIEPGVRAEGLLETVLNRDLDAGLECGSLYQDIVDAAKEAKSSQEVPKHIRDKLCHTGYNIDPECVRSLSRDPLQVLCGKSLGGMKADSWNLWQATHDE